jgi:hypothetical protein
MLLEVIELRFLLLDQLLSFLDDDVERTHFLPQHILPCHQLQPFLFQQTYPVMVFL